MYSRTITDFKIRLRNRRQQWKTEHVSRIINTCIYIFNKRDLNKKFQNLFAIISVEKYVFTDISENNKTFYFVTVQCI